MSKTRTQLEAAIRYKIQEAAAKEHSSDRILDAINDIAEELWLQLSAMAETGFCMDVTTPVDIEGGEDTYDLPSTLVTFDAVQVWDGSMWLTVEEKVAPQQVEQWPGTGSVLSAGPTAYCLLNDTVILLPCPQADISDGLRFIGRLNFTPLAGANSTSGMPAALDTVIVNLASATLLLEEGNQAATAWEAKGQAKRERIMTQLAVRDQSPRLMNTEFQADYDPTA